MSVPGTSDHPGSHGFTLVEVLVVLALIAVAAAAALTLIRPRSGELADEARRVAVLLDRLALESRLAGRYMAWRCADAGVLVFERAGNDAAGQRIWEPWPVADRLALAASVRVDSVSRDEAPVDCMRRQVFPPHGLSDGWVLGLSDAAGNGRRVVGDAFGRFTVVDPAAEAGEGRKALLRP